MEGTGDRGVGTSGGLSAKEGGVKMRRNAWLGTLQG